MWSTASLELVPASSLQVFVDVQKDIDNGFHQACAVAAGIGLSRQSGEAQKYSSPAHTQSLRDPADTPPWRRLRSIRQRTAADGSAAREARVDNNHTM